ncbi:MAG TPA: DUF4271 domain-containing protein, partial [Bacteroidia bacterium]|nr:DUF4271 domain-containing protein [Bacteroidia bacterium]
SKQQSFAALTDSAFVDTLAVKPEQAIDLLFKNHLLQFDFFYPQTFDKPVSDWFSILLLIVISTVTLLKVFYSKIFFQIFKAFFNNNTANQIIRDENLLVQRASILLSVICYVVLALFAYNAVIYFHIENRYLGNGFALFLSIAIIIALSYSVKMIVLKALGSIFYFNKPVTAYIFNIFLINNVLGIVLIPFIILGTYLTANNNLILFAGLALVIIFFIYRLVKGMLLWTGTNSFNLFYLFLYICALEISPLLILSKLLLIQKQ